MNSKQALLILDAQVNMFANDLPIYQAERTLAVLISLLEKARRTGILVVFVRNNGGAGEPDEPGSPGWEIHPALMPKRSKIVLDKYGPDAFEGTNLKDILEQRAIGQLIFAGMQTEMCIETSLQRAVDLGYQVTLVADGHSTFDFEDQNAAAEIKRVNTQYQPAALVMQADEINFQQEGE